VILIDTSPLVSLCDDRESSHRKTVEQLQSLSTRDFAVCDAVLAEACFHLPHRSQRQRLQGILRALDVRPLPPASEPAFWSDVVEWLIKYADHEPDWADACIAVLCGRDKALKVWTHDREFRTIWRRPNGTVIPLAIRLP
jgi:predicted nucleic acid-binding protein